MHPRLMELAAEAPIRPRGVFLREDDRVLLCGTIGVEFDIWQRRLSALSAADALFAQQIGLEAVEREMDALEAEVRGTLAPEERLLPRRSPGYGDLPIELSCAIVAKLDATKRIGVSVNDAGLLLPTKSVTALCKITTGSGECDTI